MGIENWAHDNRSVENVDVLDRQVSKKFGSLEHQVIYIRGHHPHLGRLHWGWSGEETIVEKDVIKPVKIFMVYERKVA